MSQHDYVLQTEPMQPLVSPPPPPVPSWVRRSGLLCAAYVIGVHLGLCDDTYRQAPYLGASFVAGALVVIIGASIAAAGRRFGRAATVLAWTCTCVVMLAALVAFVLSRTTGLPTYHHTDWPLIQIIAVVTELAYVALTAVALRHLARAQNGDAAG